MADVNGQMNLFEPPNMHANYRGELKDAPRWMQYSRCENCTRWKAYRADKQPPEGWGIQGWCAEHGEKSNATSYCQNFEDKNKI